jgi:hypothetical protein
VLAKLLPVRVLVDVDGNTSTISGVPYQIA